MHVETARAMAVTTATTSTTLLCQVTIPTGTKSSGWPRLQREYRQWHQRSPLLTWRLQQQPPRQHPLIWSPLLFLGPRWAVAKTPQQFRGALSQSLLRSGLHASVHARFVF